MLLRLVYFEDISTSIQGPLDDELKRIFIQSKGLEGLYLSSLRSSSCRDDDTLKSWLTAIQAYRDEGESRLILSSLYVHIFI